MILRITSFLFALTLSSGALLAQVPAKMSYQGVLTDGAGASVADGNHSLVFKLYSVSTAGSALWTETQATVNTTNGVLSVVLGSVTPINIAFDGALWLGIAVDGGGELTPRIELTTSPYAFQAESVTAGQVVTSVNALTDAVTLTAGSNVTITPSGNDLTIASSAAGGNNLDMAYDEGGAGVGRTITADTGPLDITGTGGLQVTDGGVLFTGTTGTIPATGAGTRLMWYPAKGALRAGKVTGTDWDDVNIGTSSTITGGEDNAASGAHATVSGGINNAASGQYGTVAGGEGSLAGGISSTVPGGKDNEASGNYSFAAGQRAKANHAGAFVWADQTAADFASTAADQFLIRAAGGVGIGTASPSAIFHTSKDTGPNWSYITNNGAAAGDHAGLWFATDHDGTADWAAIGIYDGDGKLRLTGSTALSTPGMTLDNSNNVGIGTTTPSVPLVVHRASGTNSVYISNDGAGAGDQNHLWFISDRDGTADWAGVGIQNADGQLRLTGTSSLNIPGMTLDNGNNIGIGTTTPATNLPAAFDDDSGNAKILDIRSAVAGDVGLFLSRADGSTTGMQLWTDYSAGHTYFDNVYDNADGDIRFRTRTAGTAVDALHIQGDGNVGIGTASPSHPLHVAGGDIYIPYPGASSTDGFRLALGNVEGYIWRNQTGAFTEEMVLSTNGSSEESVGERAGFLGRILGRLKIA